MKCANSQKFTKELPFLKMCKIIHKKATQVCFKLLSRNSKKSTFPLPAELDQEVNPPCFFVYDCWVLWVCSTVFFQNQMTFFFLELKDISTPFSSRKFYNYYLEFHQHRLWTTKPNIAVSKLLDSLHIEFREPYLKNVPVAFPCMSEVVRRPFW